VFVSSAARRQRARAKRKPILQAIKTRFHKTRGIIGFFCRSFPPTISDAREKLNPPLIYALIFHQLCFFTADVEQDLCAITIPYKTHTPLFSAFSKQHTIYFFVTVQNAFCVRKLQINVEILSSRGSTSNTHTFFPAASLFEGQPKYF